MIAQNVIANAPFGHALAIQNRDVAPIARTTRNAVMEGGSQSGDVQTRHSPDGDHVAWIDHAGEPVQRARHAEHADGGAIRQEL